MADSYYKQIKGKTYDRAMLEVAEKAEANAKGGKPVIGMDLAQELFEALVDGQEYTDVEKKSMKYIRANYLFTPEADEYIRREIRRFAAIQSSPVLTEVDKLKKITEAQKNATDSDSSSKKSKSSKAKASSSSSKLDSSSESIQEDYDQDDFPLREDDSSDYRELVEYRQEEEEEVAALENKRRKRMIRIGLIVLFVLMLLGITWSVCRPKSDANEVSDPKGFETIDESPNKSDDDVKEASNSWFGSNNDEPIEDPEYSRKDKELETKKEAEEIKKSEKLVENKQKESKDEGPGSEEFSREPGNAAPVVRKAYNINSLKSSISFVNYLEVPFVRNQDDLTSEGKKALDELATILNKHNQMIVRIEGHTCWIGTKEDNQKLSEERASVVYNYLKGKGVSDSNLSKRGYGELDPVATNRTKEGRLKNRRVEFTVLELK
ncbi:OmpA family protein [Leptospira sp. GIMC2001]|uniref:OmpA family protein n=1 Tax=Leptospira sp. GIMC2001 TaxID=1513297 RepID=UPI00234921D3|nr:OmpA family protein [Leptospira sp. GIMC2001]WCL49795.1 OmpA family protein [Leptospira sp. GIMC2001]